jgi:hypothetical protein
MHKAERIANPSEPQSKVAALLDSNAILSMENDCSPEQWSRQLQVPHHLFPKGTTHREISDYLDEIKLSNEHKLEILTRIFEPTLLVAVALDYEGEYTIEEDCDGYEWEQLCSRDIRIFPEGTPKSEVADYIDALRLTKEHEDLILDNLFD